MAMTSRRIQELEEQLTASTQGIEKIDALNALALELILDDNDRASQLAQQALQLSRDISVNDQAYEKGLALGSAILGSIARNRSDYINALSWLIDAQIRLANLEEKAVQIVVLSDLGWVYLNLGNFAQAIEVLVQGLKIARDIGDRINEARILNTLGAVYGENGDREESIEAHQRALTCLEINDDLRLRCLIFNNLAMTQYENKDYERALDSAARSLEIARQLASTGPLVTVLDTIGQIHLARQNYEKAKGFFRQAMTEFQGQGIDPVELRFNLARAAIGQNQLDEAERGLKETFISIESRGANRFRYQYYELMALIFENRGNYVEAIEHFKSFHEIKSQVYNEEAQRRYGNLLVSQQAETARIDAEIYRLKNLALRREITAHRQAVAEMEILATTDTLTGLLNRRHLITLGGYAFDTARKTGQPLVIFMLDIDDFKKVNDLFGHPTGDQALIEVSASIQSSLRKADLLCRYGGEEFVAVLPETGLDAAQKVAERILQRAAQSMQKPGLPDIRVTLSIGIALADASDTNLEQLIDRADQVLLKAKRAGKNQFATAMSGKVDHE
jgi:diguanylate cyclase (GGDEF)-like protein